MTISLTQTEASLVLAAIDSFQEAITHLESEDFETECDILDNVCSKIINQKNKAQKNKAYKIGAE